MEKELMNERKIGATNISLLMLVYEYDLDKRRVDSLAKHMGWTVNDLHQNIERLRGQDFYKRYYGMCAAFLDESRGLGRAALLDSLQHSPDEVSIASAFRVLKDREVPMGDIVAKMASPAMRGAYLAAVGTLKESERTLPERSLMTEALTLTAEKRTSDAVERVNRDEPDAAPLKSLAEEVKTLRELHELVEKPEELLRPGVEACLAAIRGSEPVEEPFKELAQDDVAISQLVRLVTETSPGWWIPSEEEKGKKPEMETLMPLLVETDWFKRYIGENLEHIDRAALLETQLAVAEAYVAYLTREGRLLPLVGERYEELQSERDLRVEWDMEAQYILKHGGETAKEIDLESLKKAYGKDLSRAVGVMGRGDTLLFGSLLNRLESKAREEAAELREKPSAETLTAYERHLDDITLINRMVARRPIESEVELRKVSQGASTVGEHFVKLLYQQFTDKIAIASRQPIQRGWRVLDHAVRESDAIRYAELFAAKLKASGGVKPWEEAVRQDWHLSRSQPIEQYMGVPLKAGMDNVLLGEEELARIKRICFDREKAVNFDLQNDGVADVVQTDENRADYQQRVLRDQDNGQRKGMAR